MAKPPKVRHSGTARQPVTIDLSSQEVERASPQTPSEKSETPGATQEPAAAAAKPTASNGKPASSDTPEKPAAADAKASTSAAQADKPSGPAPSAFVQQPAAASGSGFGRNPGASGPQPKAAEPAGSSAKDTSRSTVPPQAAPALRAPRRGGFLAGGVSGGVIALLAAAGLQMAGLWPSAPAATNDNSEQVTALQQDIADLRATIANLETSTAAPATDDPRIGELQSALAGLGDDVSNLRDQVATAQTDSQNVEIPDISGLETRLAALEEAGSAAADTQAVDALSERLGEVETALSQAQNGNEDAAQRLSAIEEQIAGLSGRIDEMAGNADTARIISASALKAAIDRGGPFAAELETMTTLAPDVQGLDALQPYAEAGVATRQQIAAEADEAANAIVSSGRPADPQAGFLERLFTSAEGLVTVRPVGMVEGEDVPSIAARMEAAIVADDYERAIAEFEQLPAEAQAAGQSFIDKVRARHAVDQEISRVLADALNA
jgi:hypothetical protein